MPHPQAADLHITEQKFNNAGEPLGYCELVGDTPGETCITIWTSGASEPNETPRYVANRAFANRILRGLALLEAQEAASETK